jgi:DNA-binding GntR family transcriptional regulator
MDSINSFTPIQLPNVATVVYERLRHQILGGALRPGHQLNIREIETQLHVSRTPLKMALERLQVEGLITIHPRRGTYVTIFSPQDLRECFEIRIALEAQALRTAFDAHNRERLEELSSLFARMDTYFRDEATWLEELIEFMDCDRVAHVLMIEMGGNTRMKEMYEHANVQGYIAVFGMRFSYTDTLQTQSEHRAIAAALHARDRDALLHAARAHLERAGLRAVQRLSQRNGGEA